MQGELFGASASSVPGNLSGAQSSWMDRFRVTLRLDHMAIVGILALVLYVLIFSFGVEKGKRFAIEELKAVQAKQEQINQELNLQKQEPQVVTPVVSLATAATTVPEVAREPQSNPLPAPSQAPLVGKYTIQLITFTSHTKAEKEVERLKEKGYQSFIISAGKFHQVCVNAFETATEAKQKLGELKSDGIASPDAYIRPFKSAVLA